MTDMQTLFQTVKSMTPEERWELYNYLAEYLHNPPVSDAKPEKRVIGLFANTGNYWMSDDFDAELPDEFWGFDKDL